MGKPKGRSFKRKQKVKQDVENPQNEYNTDEFMQEASNQFKGEMNRKSEKIPESTPVVLEDIRIISHIQNSKISKKKEKRKQKREKLFAKLKSSDAVRLQTKQAKERSKAVIVGDMKPLMDALPELQVDTHSVEEKSKLLSTTKLKKKNWNDKKWKTKRKEELHDIDLFKKVLQLPEYKQDPVCAIASHVEYMVKGELI